MQGFPLTPNQLSDIQFVLCNPVTFNDIKILKLIDLLSLFINDRKVFTAKPKANDVNSQQCNESSVTVINPVTWEK